MRNVVNKFVLFSFNYLIVFIFFYNNNSLLYLLCFLKLIINFYNFKKYLKKNVKKNNKIIYKSN